MIPTDAQAAVIAEALTADRPICWLGGVRAGKTVGACMALLEVMESRPGGAYAVMAFAHASLDRNVKPVLRELLEFSGEPWQERKASPHWIETAFGKIWFFTASDAGCEKSLQGVTLNGAITDEILLYPRNVVMQLIARFSHDDPLWIMTANKANPKHWIKTQWIDEGKVIEVNSGVEDNPHVSRKALRWHEDLITGHFRDRMIKNEWSSETLQVKAPGPDLPLPHFQRIRSQASCLSLWHDSAIGGAVVELARIEGEIVVTNCVEAMELKDLPLSPKGTVIAKQTIHLANAACASFNALGSGWLFVPDDPDTKAVHMSMCTAPLRFVEGKTGTTPARKALEIWSYEPDRGGVRKPKPQETTPVVLAIMQGYYTLTRGVPAFRYKGQA